MNKAVFVYLAGPITPKHGYSAEENVAAGFKVFLACINAGIPAFCPQMTGAFPSAWSDVSYGRWLQYDMAVIERCTHVLMLPRWETSDGAKAEKSFAESIGKPVLLSFEELWESVAPPPVAIEAQQA